MLSLVFEPGKRPDADAIAELAQGPAEHGRSFAVTHRAPSDEGWLELLVGGLTFDCRGLAPARQAEWPRLGSLLGLDTAPAEGEAVTLEPGPHVAGGAALLPVVRALAGLGARLSLLPGLAAVCWEPARSWMEPAYFRRIIDEWTDGGAFPALGLTSLERLPDGSLRSLGLGFLIGQELSIAADSDHSPQQRARIAVRLIHELVAGGPLVKARIFTGPENEKLTAEPVSGGRLVKIGLQK